MLYLYVLLGVSFLTLNDCLGHSGVEIVYNHELELVPEGVYHVKWGFDGDWIGFELTVQTTGWIGFGISPTGGMEGADILMVWAEDGSAHYMDMHALEHGPPVLDECQDWVLHFISENDTHTTAQVMRKLDLCGEEDQPITASTMRIIWAYNNDDPTSDCDINYYNYHSDNRGSRSVQLISFSENAPELPDDAFSFDLKVENVVVPSEATTYYCQGFALPQMDVKNHIIRIEPLITPGNEGLVHHILLYSCLHDVDPAHVGYGSYCFTASMPTIDECISTSFAWAIGGGVYNYPGHVGWPLGEEDSPLYMRIEIHYDNPLQSNEYVDSSGFRFWVTPTLREFDAGTLQVGADIDPNTMFVPPGQEHFISRGWCMGECLSEALEDNPDGIHVFANTLHAHVAGTQIRLRHFRDGEERPLIDGDTTYDFNFQEIRTLPQEVTLLPGDDLLLECTYKTLDRESLVFAGLGTSDEMCLVFLYYYPKFAMTTCQSNLWAEDVGAVIGGNVFFNSEAYEWQFTSPDAAAGYSIPLVMLYQDWINDPYNLVDGYQNAIKDGQYAPVCRVDIFNGSELNYIPIDMLTKFDSIPDFLENTDFCQAPEVDTCEEFSPQTCDGEKLFALIPNIVAAVFIVMGVIEH